MLILRKLNKYSLRTYCHRPIKDFTDLSKICDNIEKDLTDLSKLYNNIQKDIENINTNLSKLENHFNPRIDDRSREFLSNFMLLVISFSFFSFFMMHMAQYGYMDKIIN